MAKYNMKKMGLMIGVVVVVVVVVGGNRKWIQIVMIG